MRFRGPQALLDTQDDGWHLCQHLACVAAQLNGVKRHLSRVENSPHSHAGVPSGSTR
jgi:hypothetical protein